MNSPFARLLLTLNDVRGRPFVASLMIVRASTILAKNSPYWERGELLWLAPIIIFISQSATSVSEESNARAIKNVGVNSLILKHLIRSRTTENRQNPPVPALIPTLN